MPLQTQITVSISEGEFYFQTELGNVSPRAARIHGDPLVSVTRDRKSVNVGYPRHTDPRNSVKYEEILIKKKKEKKTKLSRKIKNIYSHRTCDARSVRDCVPYDAVIRALRANLVRFRSKSIYTYVEIIRSHFRAPVLKRRVLFAR